MHRYSLIIITALFLIFGATVASVVWLFHDNPLLSPLTSGNPLQVLINHKPPTHPKIVYGFLPYWNLKDAVLQPELLQVAYFSLTFDHTGTIVIKANGETDQGYHKLQSDDFVSFLAAAKQNHSQVEIVLAQFDADEIASFLTNNQAQDKLLAQLNSILLEYPFTGVNVDIEYAGTVTPTLQQDLTAFMQKLRANLNNRRSTVALSIDIFSSAGNNQNIWDLKSLADTVDNIIVMAYDFHRASSPLAGPVAPLFGGQKLWDSDITEHLKEILQSVPANKILLGVPFYGYEWQTTSRSPQAQTLPETGGTASFDRVQSILAQKDELKVQEGWSDDALSPYLSYQKGGKTYIIYYENSRSLSYKLDLVNQLDLHGIAIWALGYEKSSRELWDTIKNKL